MERIIIGIGNGDRGDDGAGVAVAEELTECTTHVVDAGALDIFGLWNEDDNVVVIDAMRSGAAPGTIRSFDVRENPLPEETFASTHSFGPAAGIELARVLGRMPASLEVIGIEAGDFTAGSSLSPPVQRAVQDVTRRLADA